MTDELGSIQYDTVSARVQVRQIGLFTIDISNREGFIQETSYRCAGKAERKKDKVTKG